MNKKQVKKMERKLQQANVDISRVKTLIKFIEISVYDDEITRANIDCAIGMVLENLEKSVNTINTLELRCMKALR